MVLTMTFYYEVLASSQMKSHCIVGGKYRPKVAKVI